MTISTKTFTITVCLLLLVGPSFQAACDEGALDSDENIETCVDMVTLHWNISQPEGLVNSGTTLSTFISLQWSASSTTEQVCCESKTWSNPEVLHNPVRQPERDAEDVFNVPSIHLASTASYSNGDNKQYAFALLDTFDEYYGTSTLPYVHWLFMNSDGSNSTNGNTIASYVPPIEADRDYLLLVWAQAAKGLLVRMDNYVSLDHQASCPQMNRCFFDVTSFERDKNLALIGASWFNVKKHSASKGYSIYHDLEYEGGDTPVVCTEQYGTDTVADEIECVAATWCNAESRADSTKLLNCLEKNKIYLMSETNLITEDDTMQLTIEPTWTSSAFKHDDVCCEDINYAARSVTHDMMSSTIVRNHETEPVPIMTYTSSNPNDVTIGNGELYTVVIIDITIDDLTSEFGSASHPLAHMVVVNLASLNISTGNFLLPYHTLDKPHKYMWMVYKQTPHVTISPATDMALYTTEAPYYVDKSCFFDIEQFKVDHSLVLVGATIIDMTPNSLAYYAYQLMNVYEPKQTPEKTCQELFDFSSYRGVVQCPVPTTTSGAPRASTTTSGAPRAFMMCWLLVVSWFIALFV